MRKTLLIVLPLLLISFSISQEPVNYETTFVERDGVYYTKDTNQPYNGQVFSLYEDGKKKEEGTIKDGKQNGLWTEWYENGQKWNEETYEDGESISKKSWNEDGSVRE